jgi:hypothetical protein
MSGSILKEYLNPARVARVGKSTGPSSNVPTGYVRVACFDNGMFKVCPNPYDTARFSEAQKIYEKGGYISAEYYLLTDDQFDNPAFWNS